MSFETLNARTRKLLDDAGIKTAVQALQAGKEGLTNISGIGETTADQILAAAEAELTGAAVGTPAPQEPTPEVSDLNTPNSDPDVEPGGAGEPGDAVAEPEPESDDTAAPVADDPVAGDPEGGDGTPVYADWEDRPTEVVIRLNTLASAILGGSRILQGESRRVPFAQFETAVADYPGAWLVRFQRDGEFEVA
jgi:hypothetical protein